MISRPKTHAQAQILAQLKLVVGDATFPIPDWSVWLIWLGAWMKEQSKTSGRRVCIVRLPSRRTAAAFTVLGVLLTSARMHDDSLDWDTLKSLPVGTQVYWREKSPSGSAKPRARSGKVLELRRIDDSQLMVVSVDTRAGTGQTTHLFSKASALGYGITLGSITAKADAQLSGLSRITEAFAGGLNASWLRTPHPECVLLTEKELFMSDLGQLSVRCKDISEPFGNVLALTDTTGHMYGKTRLVSPRTSVIPDDGLNVIVLDGAKALQRIPDTTARSVIAIVDRAEYDEEIEQVIARLMGHRCDEFVQVFGDGVLAPPEQLEAVVFGLPDAQISARQFEDMNRRADFG